MQLSTRIRKGMLQNIGSIILLLLNKFIIVGLIVNSYTSSEYSDWIYIASFSATISLFNFGWNKSIINAHILNNRNDSNFVDSCLGIGMISSIVLISYAVVNHIINHDRVYSSALIMIIYNALLLPSRVVLNYYITQNKFYKSRFLLNLEEGLRILILFSIIRLGGEIYLFPYAYILPVVLSTLYVSYTELALGNIQRFSFQRSFKVIWVDWRSSLAFYLQNITDIALVEGPVLILRTLKSTSLLPLYITHRTISNVVRTAFFMINGVVGPELTHTKRRITFEQLNALERLVLIFVLGLIIYSVFARYLVESFFQIWLGDNINFNSDIFVLFNYTVIITVFKQLCKLVLNAFNKNIAFSVVEILILVLATVYIMKTTQVSVNSIIYILITYELCSYFMSIYFILKEFNSTYKKYLSFNVLGCIVLLIINGLLWR